MLGIIALCISGIFIFIYNYFNIDYQNYYYNEANSADINQYNGDLNWFISPEDALEIAKNALGEYDTKQKQGKYIKVYKERGIYIVEFGLVNGDGVYDYVAINSITGKIVKLWWA